MRRRTFIQAIAGVALAAPSLRAADLAARPLNVTSRGGSAYLTADALASAGIAVRELPGLKLASVCFDDRCATLKDHRREGRDLLVLIGPLAKALGLKAEFNATQSQVMLSLEPFTPKPGDGIIRAGQLLPDIRLLKLDGQPVALSEYRGRRIVLNNWASWCGSRNDLAVWQKFYGQRRGPRFELLSVVLDVQGPAHARTYATRHQVTFPVLLDTADALGAAFGWKNTPFTLVVDEVGFIRFSGAGPTPAVLQQIFALLDEPWLDLRGRPPRHPSALSRTELDQQVAANPDDLRARLELGQSLNTAGQSTEALKQFEEAARRQPRSAEAAFAWGAALLQQKQPLVALPKFRLARDLDPDNWRYRRQLWALEHPDKFYTAPSPDLAWQKEQLAREQTAKAAK
jgi:tetratricopeptide (TPR) repeat protein